jgi:hypothetical protein
MSQCRYLEFIIFEIKNNKQNSVLSYHGRFAAIILFCINMMSGAFGTSFAYAQTTPAGLPTYFALGLKNTQPNLSWMPQSGVPWNYRYQYLNVGWENWNSPSGQIVTDYIQSSRSNGYIPVFSWYVAGSQGPSLSTLFSNLSTPSFMNTYFTSFKLMLQKAGAFSSTVIVHVEPDLWSQMQQQRSQDPTQIKVSVASSGFAEVSGFANNASGFAQALIALRNKYAPKVLLAWDNSTWAINYDPTCSGGCWNSASAYGGWVADFYKKLAANFDLIFFNTSDRDSGYKVTVMKQSSSYAWWSNTAFTNMQQYIAAIYNKTGRKSMLWQTPIGNTLYRTENNTSYHYQDNRAQYFLIPANKPNITNYVNAGVIGILFGDGIVGSTTYWDEKQDGITNPPAINGNTQVSTCPDDDGGFLRTSAKAYYYSGPVPVP